MIKMQKIKTRNWDGNKITALHMIKDRYEIDSNNIDFVVKALEAKSLNKRFHDEPKKIVNEMIRKCHGSMGMYSSSRAGCLYYEDGAYELKKDVSVEHTVPVANLIDLYIQGNDYRNIGKKHSFGFVLFFPVCLLSKTSNSKLKLSAKNNNNIRFPFRRYLEAGIEGPIFDCTGNKIDLFEYTIKDHFDLVLDIANTDKPYFSNELAEILNHFNVSSEIDGFLSAYGFEVSVAA